MNSKINKRKNWDKYLYTSIFCYANLTYGIASTSVASVLTDLKFILKTSTELTSHYFTLYAIGYLFGSLCGLTSKYVNRQLMLIVMLFLISIAISATPLCVNLVVFYILAFINGMGSGALDCTQNVWTIEMWKQNSGPILQLVQFSYGLGTIIGPLIEKPYVTGESNEKQIDYLNKTNIFVNISKSVQTVTIITAETRKSSLTKPFFIVGSLFILSAFLMLYMFIFRRYKYEEQKLNQIEVLTSSESSVIEHKIKLCDESGSPNKLLICLGAFCIASYSAIELAYFQFIPAFGQYIELRLSASESATLLSAMATSYTVGRGLSVFIAIKVRPQHLLICHYFLLCISSVILSLSQNSTHLLWTGIILMGIGFSAMWSALFAYMEQYLVISNNVGSIFIFAVGAVSASLPFIIGPLLSSLPIILIYFCIFSLTLSFITFIIIRIIITNFERHVKNNSYNTQRMRVESINAVITHLSIKRLSSVNLGKYDQQNKDEKF